MLSNNSKNKLNELITMLTESDLEAIPRIIVVDKNSKLWKETINKAINADRNIFKSSEYVLTYKLLSGDHGIESKPFNGDLYLALHNVLASLDRVEDMIINVENVIARFSKGIRVQQRMKLIYIVLKD